MVTLFKSQGLWDLVNNGVPDPDPNQQENEKEDARTLFYIQLAVHDTIFSKIAAATNAKEAWTTLKIAFKRVLESWQSNFKAYAGTFKHCK
jgi:hypothetical protein